MPSRTCAARSSFSRRRPRSGPASEPTELEPPSPRVVSIMPQRTSARSPHTPHGALKDASSSGCAHTPRTSSFVGSLVDEVWAWPNAHSGASDEGAARDGVAYIIPGTRSAHAPASATDLSRCFIANSPVLFNNHGQISAFNCSFGHSGNEAALQGEEEDHHRQRNKNRSGCQERGSGGVLALEECQTQRGGAHPAGR